jgi:hypothetical protein
MFVEKWVFFLVLCFFLLGIPWHGSHSAQVEGPFFYVPSETSLSASKAPVGRYLYLGAAPKFKSRDLELTIGKSSFTLRVKAKVSREMIEGYASYLWKRLSIIKKDFKNQRLIFEPLITNQNYEEFTGKVLGDEDRLWLNTAFQFSEPIFQNHPRNVLPRSRNGFSYSSYKQIILDSYENYLFFPESVKSEFETPNPQSLEDAQYSELLFKAHYSDQFTEYKTQNGSYVGYLTFVYPIAIEAQGPFVDDPREGVHRIQSIIEAYWHSGTWAYEFAGLPFIRIDSVANGFHGPISRKKSLKTWYLDRAPVSHGCLRMNPSDLMELRQLLPVRERIFTGPVHKPEVHQSIPVRVLNGFDVTDWDLDGDYEVVDVAYYSSFEKHPLWSKYLKQMEEIALSNTSKRKQVKISVSELRRAFYSQRYQRLSASLSEYHRSVYGREISGRSIPNVFFSIVTGRFSNLPIFDFPRSVASGYAELKRKGIVENLNLKVFPYRGGQVIQYRDRAISPYSLSDFPNGSHFKDDRAGPFSPDKYNNIEGDSPQWLSSPQTQRGS